MICDTKGCGNEVVVKRNENGTLSYRCDECDAAPYARVGTGQYQAWSDELKLETETKQQPENKPAKPAGVGFFG